MSGAKIMKARRGRGWTRGELAKRAGVSFETIKSWEQGRRKPCCRFMMAELKRILAGKGS